LSIGAKVLIVKQKYQGFEILFMSVKNCRKVLSNHNSDASAVLEYGLDSANRQKVSKL
jgi:hypothetical protein